MTHRQRLAWLSEHGFVAEDRGIVHATLGTCSLVTGERQGDAESLWLAARDGAALVHTSSLPALSWVELQEWIEPTVQAEPVRPMKGQKSLFGE